MTGLFTAQANQNQNYLERRKMENWRELLKDKPVKYWIRTEIEEIIKKNQLTGNGFMNIQKQTIKRL